MIGKVISRYRIVKKLGAGGMGEVYLAEDAELDRKVALKFLPPQFTDDAEINARFRHEAKAAAGLSHPNIVTVYDVGEYEGKTFIVMEHVEGQSLRDIMDSNLTKLQKIGQILAYAIQIGEGLAAAHNKGIVHRDIKPANILVDGDGRVKIADFGLAKAHGRTQLTEEGTTLGTLDYMSPEQIQGLDVDHRADIWSFGVVFYEMITGHPPFKGEYEAAVSYAILHEEPEPLARYKAGVSDGLQRIIDNALDKEKETRYQSVSDLLADLRREKRDSSAIVKPVGKAKKAVWRKRVFATASLLLVAVLAILAINRLQVQKGPSLAVTHEQITFDGNIPIAPTTPSVRDLSAISPDGQFLAYPLARDGGQSVMLQDLAGGQVVEVYQGFQSLGWLRWSPDGSRLLLGGFEKDTNLPRNLIIPRLGGKPQALPLLRRECWSPDGAQIAAVSHRLLQSITFYNAATADSIGSIRLHGFHWFVDIDWSPVGNRIVFLTTDEPANRITIWTVQTDGTQQQKIVEEEAGLLYSPRWSSDGQAIYYLRDHGQTRDLMKIAVSARDGTPVGDAKVLQSGLRAFGLTLSADNRKLSYTNYLEYTNLWLVTRTGEELETQELTRGTHSYRACRISPDGQKVAFGQGPNIFVMPITGGEMQQLTFFKSDTYKDYMYQSNDICWSPDGKELAFFLDCKVWLVPADGGTAQAFENTDSWGDLAWVPHSGILHKKPGSRNSHFLNPLTGKERPLLSNDSLGLIFGPACSPDGRNVAVFWNRNDGDGTEFDGLWLISLTDSSQTLLSKGHFAPIEWSGDGKGIYAFNNAESPAKIYLVPLSGGQPKVLLTMPFEKIRHGGWGAVSMTSNGKRIVCNVEETKSDVWVMENFDPEVK